MGLRGADVRFLLPRPPCTAAVLPGSPVAAHDLALAGIGPPTTGRPLDVAFCGAAAVPAANETGAPALVVRGGPATRLSLLRRGWSVSSYVVAQGPDGPRLLVLADPAVRRFVAGTWSRPTSRVGRARNLALAGPLGNLTARLHVATRTPSAPYPVAAASAAASGWFMQLGRGDDLQRVVAQVMDRDETTPSRVIKFSRVPGAPARGSHETDVLAEVARLSPAVSAQCSRVLATVDLGGSEASVEEAVQGATLTAALQSRTTDQAVDLTQGVLRWARRLARDSARSSAALHQRTKEDLAAWGADFLVGGLPTLACLAHNDLGTWNVVTAPPRFTVVDWESASLHGLPLSDVAYLATDALAEISGPRDHCERPSWVCDLWAGRLPASALLRSWVLDAAAELDLEPRTVGPLVTATWLSHGRSRDRRAALLGGAPAAAGYLGLVARPWVAHEALGTRWPGFER